MLTGRLSGRRVGDVDPAELDPPAVGSSKPPIIRRVVVLPQPDGPSSEKNSPGRISSEMSSTARTSRNRFDTPDRRISGTASETVMRGQPTGRLSAGARRVPSSATRARRERSATGAALIAGPASCGPRSATARRPSRRRTAGPGASRSTTSGAWSDGIGGPLRASRSISAQTTRVGDRRLTQEMVDPHPEVLVEVAGPVVPPREAAGLGALAADRRRPGPARAGPGTPPARARRRGCRRGRPPHPRRRRRSARC